MANYDQSTNDWKNKMQGLLESQYKASSQNVYNLGGQAKQKASATADRTLASSGIKGPLAAKTQASIASGIDTSTAQNLAQVGADKAKNLMDLETQAQNIQLQKDTAKAQQEQGMWSALGGALGILTDPTKITSIVGNIGKLGDLLGLGNKAKGTIKPTTQPTTQPTTVTDTVTK